MDGASEVL